jgi:hypothetical protein
VKLPRNERRLLKELKNTPSSASRSPATKKLKRSDPPRTDRFIRVSSPSRRPSGSRRMGLLSRSTVPTARPWQPGKVGWPVVASRAAMRVASQVVKLSGRSDAISFRPYSYFRLHRVCWAPRVPFLVMIWITPAAASAP